MPNGNDPRGRALRLNRRSELLNTCAFDALLQAFTCAAADGGPPFGTRLLDGNGIAASPFVRLIRDFLAFGPDQRALCARHVLLCEAFEDSREPRPGGWYRYQTDCYVREMANKVLTVDLPTARETYGCSEPSCPRPRVVRALSAVAFSSHTGRFDGFQEAIDDELAVRRQPCTRDGCPGQLTRVIEPFDHLLVEVINIPPETLFEKVEPAADTSSSDLLLNAEAVYVDVTCPLDDVPKRLIVNGETYALQAVVAFQLPGQRATASAETIGHYVAVALRAGRRWTQFDDTMDRPWTVFGTNTRQVQMVLYTKIGQPRDDTQE